MATQVPNKVLEELLTVTKDIRELLRHKSEHETSERQF